MQLRKNKKYRVSRKEYAWELLNLCFRHASFVLVRSFLEQKQQQAIANLEREMMAELQKDKEELNKQLEMELQKELQVGTGQVISQTACHSLSLSLPSSFCLHVCTCLLSFFVYVNFVCVFFNVWLRSCCTFSFESHYRNLCWYGNMEMLFQK